MAKHNITVMVRLHLFSKNPKNIGPSQSSSPTQERPLEKLHNRRSKRKDHPVRLRENRANLWRHRTAAA